ncbi:hypothetical protein BD413DRAFT_74733 [Trametes elegans]|nr:hypothetical protein BD413DRAFT_74733 [Trametes elegans]
MPQGIQRLCVGMPMPDPDDEMGRRAPQSFARFTNLLSLQLWLPLTLTAHNKQTLKALKNCHSLVKLEYLSLFFEVGSETPYAEVERGPSGALVDTLRTPLSSDAFPALKSIAVTVDMRSYAMDHPIPDPYAVERQVHDFLDPVLREHKPSGVGLYVVVHPSTPSFPVIE